MIANVTPDMCRVRKSCDHCRHASKRYDWRGLWQKRAKWAWRCRLKNMEFCGRANWYGDCEDHDPAPR